ncbi:MAG: V-type ATPase subunit [Acidimicrobiia bacterium]|nr:V-type ATPase subunit [Acidimicrobiia bacterium]
MTGYEYGNTRLRAQRGRLLDGANYRELFAIGTTERLLGALSATPYGPDVERTLVRHDAFHQLDEAVRSHLARSLRAIRRFYEGEARAGVDLLLGRWDLRNIRSIIRLKARPSVYEDAEPMLVAAGALDEAALAELAGQPSLRSVVELMVAWDLPSRPAARRTLQEWPRYETTGDPVFLENALNHAWAAHTADALDGWVGTELEVVLRAEVDQINLLTALRLRQTGVERTLDAEAHEDDTYLPGGLMRPALLEQVRRTSTPDDLVAILARQPLPADWRAALTVWSANQDLSALSGGLERAVARNAIGLFGRGDPLGIAIPIAFTYAKECEARNLRLLGKSITHHIRWDDTEPELYPW